MTLRHLCVPAALLASVALHGTLLAALRPSGAAGPPEARASMTVRMVPAPLFAPAEQAEVVAVEIPPPVREEIARARPPSAPETPPSPPARERQRSESPPAQPLAGAGSGSTPTVVPTGEPALRPMPDYLSGAQLERRPQPLGDIEPIFPPEAGTQEGMVVLRILISETGTVDEVAVIRSEPQGLFERAALIAFQGARFSPGMALGMPVKSQIDVQVDFTPFNRGAAVSGRGY